MVTLIWIKHVVILNVTCSVVQLWKIIPEYFNFTAPKIIGSLPVSTRAKQEEVWAAIGLAAEVLCLEGATSIQFLSYGNSYCSSARQLFQAQPV